jgi:hypothetical protein
MGVGEHDANDRLTQSLCRLDDRLRLTGYAGVDQREPILLAHQVAIDETQTGELKKVVTSSCHFHGLRCPLYKLCTLRREMATIRPLRKTAKRKSTSRP